ncbi:MAG: hypothetical protein ABFS32_04270 [Bacteroidota bacterium]
MKTILALILATIVLVSCQFNSLDDPTDCTQSDLGFNTTVIDAQCSDNGSIDIVTTGGEAPYSFTIDGGSAQQSSLIENLFAGDYLVKVTDNLGCSVESTVTVNNVNGLIATASVSNSDCGAENGSIDITASNGLEPYQYQLGNNPPESSSLFTVGAGSYDITVIDANGCEFTITQQVYTSVTFSTNIQPIIANSCSTSACHDGSNNLSNFTIFSEVQANASMIKSRTQSGSMPKNGSLTQEQIDLIACWVDDGAQDN